MDVATLLDLVATARARLEATVARVSADRLTEPSVAGGWSVKDIIAHISWSEEEIGPVFETHVFEGSPHWMLSTDERNAIVFQERRDLLLDEVIATEKQAYTRVLAVLHTLTDEDLNDASLYRDIPPDVPPWEIIAGGTYRHYDEHTEMIEAWLSAS